MFLILSFLTVRVSCYDYRRLWRNHRKIYRESKTKEKKKKGKRKKNVSFSREVLRERREKRHRFVYKLKKSQKTI